MVSFMICFFNAFPTGGADFVPTGRLPRSAREIKGDELTLCVSCGRQNAWARFWLTLNIEHKYRYDDIIKNKHQVFLICFLEWSLNAKACLQLTFGRTPKPNENKFHICSIPRIYIYGYYRKIRCWTSNFWGPYKAWPQKNSKVLQLDERNICRETFLHEDVFI